MDDVDRVSTDKLTSPVSKFAWKEGELKGNEMHLQDCGENTRRDVTKRNAANKLLFNASSRTEVSFPAT